MLLLELISWGCFLYLTFYVLYIFLITQRSSSGKVIDIKNRKYVSSIQQNMSVVIYSQNNESSVVDLVESIKKQNYDSEKYSINIILDNCTDKSAKLLEIIGGTRLWRITTDENPIGKYKAYAWLLERLMAGSNSNSYVFIDATCNIKDDFLKKINDAMQDNAIIMGQLLPLNKLPNIWENIKILKHQLNSQIIKHGRFYAGLDNIIDSDVWAVKQELLEKIEFPITDFHYENYEYSVDLSKAKVPVVINNDIQVFKNFSASFKSIAAERYEQRQQNIKTFYLNLKKFLLTNNLKTKELLLSLINPSFFSFTVITLLLFILSEGTDTLFSEIITSQILIYFTGVYIIANMYMLTSARFSSKDYLHIITYGLLSPAIFAYSLLPMIKVRIKTEEPCYLKDLQGENYQKDIIKAIITDGKRELNCKMELRQNENQAQIIFIHNKRKLPTTKHRRIDDALEELIDKLKQNGFALKVCMNCGYFKYDYAIGAKYNGEQGYCQLDNLHNGSKFNTCSFIWDCCPNIIPVQARDYIQREIDKINTEAHSEQ